MVHEDYKEMIPARSLAALDANEDRLLTDHLATCAECRQELDDLLATCAALALVVPAQEPSPQLRARILSGIAADLNVSKSDNVVPFIPTQRNVWSSFGAIAAAVIFVALFASVFLLWRQNRSMQNQLTALSTQMKDTEHQLAQERRIIRQFTAPGAHMIELKPTNAAPGAKAMLAYDNTGHAMLVARGLPVAPAGKAYQLWYIVGNKPMPGKVFQMDSTGNGLLEDQMPAEAMKAVGFAITMESASGVSAPTGNLLLQSGS